jgi:tetratricopeptide (TPR) repeat protein
MALDRQKIHLFEEHSSTLPVWWAESNSPRTIVYLDAHLDLQRTSEDSISALRSCTTVDEIRALESPNHLNPSTRYAFGIENFLYPAHRLGLIERLVWVAPPHIPRQYSPPLIEYMQQMDGITFDELIGFESLGGNTLRGSLLGLDITICDYDQLDTLGLETPYYLDIDIDYFVEVPADRIWVDPGVVVNKLCSQLGSPELVTISRAVSSGFTPLGFRYIGDYLYSLFADHPDVIHYYQNLTQAIEILSKDQLEAGRAICRDLISNHPDMSPAYYILALATFDPDEKRSLLQSAEQRDSSYGFDPGREVIGMVHRKKALNPILLQQLQVSVEQLDLKPLQRAQAEVAIAQVLAMNGDTNQALRILKKQSGDYALHEDVLLAIVSRRLTDPDTRADNIRFLKRIREGTKSTSIATLYLGDLESAADNYDAAVEYYLSAHEVAPAWMLPLERLRHCFQGLKRSTQLRHVEEEIGRRKLCLERLLGESDSR